MGEPGPSGTLELCLKVCEKIWWVGYHHLLLLPDGLDSSAHIVVWDELEDDIDLVEKCEIDKKKEVKKKEKEEKTNKEEEEKANKEEEVNKEVSTLS